MHNAPPVLVPVGRFVWGGRMALVLAVLTGWFCLWAAGEEAGSGRGALGLAAWVLAAGASWWSSRREFLPAGELSWDGEGWWYRAKGAAARPASLALHWDTGQAVLLGLRVGEPDGGRMQRYLWLRASQMPLQWHGLRCAIHGRDTL